MSMPDRLVAGRIGDRYEILGLIASGGMGSVYRASDTVLERVVALKVLNASTDRAFVARFRSEATNAARLSHPSIVQVYDFGYADDVPYIAMEHVDGQTLRDLLVEHTVLRPDHAAQIATQVAAALEHARRGGIVHRDIKPENILITRDGHVKVADFGLSRAFADSGATVAGTVLGTVHYLAPEQVQGAAVDHRADLYALGVVLYEMLTGRPPFGGDSAQAVAYRRVNEDVPSAMALNPSVPRELDAVVLRATARRPENRFSTAAEMIEALRAVPRADTGDVGRLIRTTNEVPVHVEPTIAIARPRSSRTRRRKRRMVVALLVALTLAIAAVGTARSMRTFPVPGVVGLTQEAAKDALERDGFAVDSVLRNDPKVPNGRVIEQIPPEGTALRQGDLVELFVSLGPLTVRVPDVTGKLFADAEPLLRRRGFDVARVDVYDDKVPRLRVISQRPDADLLVEQGQKVTLTVSRGPEIMRVPNVRGDEEARAVDELKSAGFEVRVTTKSSETVAKGLVISQSPAGGARLRKGSVVTLVVSSGPPPVKVPDVYCMTTKQAEDALLAKGFKVKREGSGERVVDQDPAAGTSAPKGSTVTVILGFGSRCN